ncbi:ribose-5-phosphate isomerase A [Paenibacillus montaniterrae]|uniref:Ribose-5-phosphate isomerase A n=1 Tax=Paenibacillus montaniterrae TaxID=429341 RepID=A0A920CYP1_9BACL|nr:ribose-5-phosphate isomerase RpiA [Paenibacillus montaniterrae]GIP18066.1 ribose-5-phosphate isomerase A [Paenibacillus montaniterrae]
MEAKRIAAERAVDDVRDGMIVGLGTGSTAYYAIQRLGRLVQQGLSIQAIATSLQSEQLATQLGIPLVSFSEMTELDLTIDGADEVDSAFNLIKGGGGALLREKIVAAASKQLTIVVDEHKVVRQLGKFALPVEIVKFGYEATIRKLFQLGCEPILRARDGELYVTDNGNYIVDCSFNQIAAPVELHRELNLIPGVVDNGLFVGMTKKVIVGYDNGDVQVLES